MVAEVSFPSRFGLASADNQNLFLKQYSGEVLTAFEDINIMRGLTRSRTITQGKSAQFPLVGVATAAYHTPGEDILRNYTGTVNEPTYLSRPGTGEKVIEVDNILLSPILISDIDEAMAHWDVRAPYATAQGRALAEKYDLSLMQVCFNGSEKAATLSGEGSWGSGGEQIIDSDFASSAASIKATIEEAAVRFDQNDIPKEGRHFVLNPTQYYMLVSNVGASTVSMASADFPGTGGDAGRGRVMMYQGFHLHSSNRVGDLLALGSTTSADTGQRGTDYTGDFSAVEAIFFQTEGLGTVQLLGLQLQTEYMIEFQATAVVARMAVGHGVLHEAACGSVVST